MSHTRTGQQCITIFFSVYILQHLDLNLDWSIDLTVLNSCSWSRKKILSLIRQIAHTMHLQKLELAGTTQGSQNIHHYSVIEINVA